MATHLFVDYRRKTECLYLVPHSPSVAAETVVCTTLMLSYFTSALLVAKPFTFAVYSLSTRRPLHFWCLTGVRSSFSLFPVDIVCVLRVHSRRVLHYALTIPICARCSSRDLTHLFSWLFFLYSSPTDSSRQALPWLHLVSPTHLTRVHTELGLTS